jgi:hypothetical protein
MPEETPETPAEAEVVEAAEAAPKPRSNVKPTHLQKPSDFAIRPGFRNPPNARSKASKKK